MFKMPPSAFIEVVVDSGKLGTEARHFGVDFFEINSHERRSPGCCSRLRGRRAAFGSQKSNGPGKLIPGPMWPMTRRRGVGKAGIDRGPGNTSLRWPSVRCAALRQDNLGKIAVTFIRRWQRLFLRILV